MLKKVYSTCIMGLLGLSVSCQDNSGLMVKAENKFLKCDNPKVFILGEGVELVLMPIKAGSFDMGSTNKVFSNEALVRQVTLAKPFWIGRTEVTIRQFAEYIKASGERNGVKYDTADCPLDDKGNLDGKGLFGSYWDQPMVFVDWNVCMRFCNWLTERERSSGKLPFGYEFRLPTEIEWEYCCRAGTTGDYAGELDSLAWYEKNSGYKTHSVGTKKANAWGLYDMHGNAWEWCFDSYKSSLSKCIKRVEYSAIDSCRVSRGGSWNDRAVLCRSAFRGYFSPRFMDFIQGFRIVLVAIESKNASQAENSK